MIELLNNPTWWSLALLVLLGGGTTLLLDWISQGIFTSILTLSGLIIFCVFLMAMPILLAIKLFGGIDLISWMPKFAGLTESFVFYFIGVGVTCFGLRGIVNFG